MTATPRPTSPWSLAIALAAALVGCHQCGHDDDVGSGSDLVGGACEIDEHCQGHCVEGNDFPNGTCTVGCDHDGDCPDFTACVDKAGGVCLLLCDHDDECRGGYDCHDTDRRGGGGKVPVCIQD